MHLILAKTVLHRRPHSFIDRIVSWGNEIR